MGLGIAIAGGIICATVLAVFSIVFSTTGQVYDINLTRSKTYDLQSILMHTNTTISLLYGQSANNLVTFALNNTGIEKLWDYTKFTVMVTYDANILGSPIPTTEYLTFNSAQAFAQAGCDCQIARPDSDVSKENWDDAVGGDNDDVLYDEINEIARNDTNYATSGPLSSGGDLSETWEVGLSDVADPLTSSNHVLQYVYRKDAPGGSQIDLTVKLMQGTTEIASWFHDKIGATATLASQTLSTAQADSITDYNDLRIRFVAEYSNGAGTKSAVITWAQFQVPTTDGTYDCSPVAISSGQWTIDRIYDDLQDPEIINANEDGQICIKLSNSIFAGSNITALVSTDLGKVTSDTDTAS